jgi:hypothetical protein
MKDVKETLDRLVPEPARVSDWDAVLREARPRRRSLTLQLAAATAVAAFAALFVVAPWKGSERVGILDRALGAVGDQPITHVVLRGDWGGTLVDLKTGERRPLYGENEIWYDANRNVAHQISRFGGAVESEEIFSPERSASPFTVLARDYRKALEAGTARVAGRGTFDGAAVYWITFRRLMLPDVADHRDHEFAEEVAISTETFKPVAIRALRDRHAFSTERVLELETMSRDEADFSADPAASPEGRAMMQGRGDAIPVEQAAAVLGRTPFWLGSEYAGLPLSQVQKPFSSTGTSDKTLVTGERATAIRRCLDTRRRGRGHAACPRTTGSIAIRNGKVYEYGKVTWGPRHTGLTFFYGTLGDDPGTFKTEDSVPLYEEPYILVTETTDRELLVRGPPITYVPPEGSVVIVQGGSGYLVRDGLYVTIQAADDETILDAARALRPMTSAGSAAGG